MARKRGGSDLIHVAVVAADRLLDGTGELAFSGCTPTVTGDIGLRSRDIALVVADICAVREKSDTGAIVIDCILFKRCKDISLFIVRGRCIGASTDSIGTFIDTDMECHLLGLVCRDPDRNISCSCFDRSEKSGVFTDCDYFLIRRAECEFCIGIIKHGSDKSSNLFAHGYCDVSTFLVFDAFIGDNKVAFNNDTARFFSIAAAGFIRSLSARTKQCDRKNGKQRNYFFRIFHIDTSFGVIFST